MNLLIRCCAALLLTLSLPLAAAPCADARSIPAAGRPDPA